MQLNNIIVMKVGPHSNMSLNEIIKSKLQEETIHGVHYWGYSGTLCQPKPTQKFCVECMQVDNSTPYLVLLETKSSYSTDEIGFIHSYSEDGITYNSFPGPVQLQGAKFAFVTKSLKTIDNFQLSDYLVVGGKNNGKPLQLHLRSRVGKAFAQFNKDSTTISTPPMKALVAELVPPYAIWLKEGE